GRSADRARTADSPDRSRRAWPTLTDPALKITTWRSRRRYLRPTRSQKGPMRGPSDVGRPSYGERHPIRWETAPSPLAAGDGTASGSRTPRSPRRTGKWSAPDPRPVLDAEPRTDRQRGNRNRGLHTQETATDRTTGPICEAAARPRAAGCHQAGRTPVAVARRPPQ